MLEPLEESEERHPLVHTHAGDGGQGVKLTQPSSLSVPHASLGAGSAPYQPVSSRIQPLTPAMFTPHSSPSMIITRETTPPPWEAPPILETAPPPCEALPTIRNESNRQASVDVQMSPVEDVISVASSPPELSPPHQSTSSPHHRFPVHTLSPSPRHFPVHTPSPPPHQSHSSPPSQREDQLSSPLPLRKRIFRPHPLVGVASVPPTETVQGPSDPGSHDKSHEKLTGSHDQLTGSQDQPTGSHDKTSQPVQFVTPGPTGQRLVPESDTEITPMPDFSNMATPHLKGECSKFGVRALPKKKMIAKLTEIYDYTHPLTDEDGNVVDSALVAAEKASEGKKKEGAKGRGKKKVPGASSESGGAGSQGQRGHH
ncbi:Structure-specific endonuclease subunit SLX4 [Geodia barretti]|uniref:Structure-specific endonuclease subunit SLX4 n=1 Tax=Geodia barretti TaxID=519541 RepID=A0AA35XFX8_GEOBA|nr:Structure-specific endonuclease subunit SLX4 [Geodia barretti]